LRLEGFIPFFCARRHGLRLLRLPAFCFHQSALLTAPLDLHIDVFEVEINHAVLYAIETQIEHLTIEL
jgi:hypothetical protein